MKTYIEDAYAYLNLALISYRKGEYKRARKRWKKACFAYEKGREEAIQSKNADYFMDYGSIYQYNLANLEKAEKIYNDGLKIAPDHDQILLNLIELNLLRKNEAIENTDEAQLIKRSAHWKAMQYFRMLEAILIRRLEEKEEESVLMDLGKLYLMIEDNDKAEDYLQRAYEAYEMKKDLSGREEKALASLEEWRGFVSMRKETYKQAISSYRNALRSNPDDLNLKSSIAEALLKARRKYQAENEYSGVLSIAPSHIDSLIGLGETYTAMGEDAKRRGDSGTAADHFSSALYYYGRAIELDQNDPDDSDAKLIASKTLTKQERSALYYSQGYCKVMLYEGQSGKNINHLIEAKDLFEEVNEGTSNYYKARRAIAKIDERIAPPQEAFSRWGPRIILSFSIIVFLAVQFMFLIGKPVITGKQYSIDEKKLENYFLTMEVSKEIIEKAQPFMKKYYDSYGHARDTLTNVAGEEFTSKFDISDILKPTGPVGFAGFEKLKAGSYALLTFGTLIFMVAGFYLQEISRLKLGAIELEKSTIEQVSTSSSLGIGKKMVQLSRSAPTPSASRPKVEAQEEVGSQPLREPVISKPSETEVAAS